MKKIFLLLLLFITGSKAFSQGPLNSLHFDGSNDYVSCPLPALFTDIAANDFTFEAWVNREGAGRIFYAQYDASNMASVLLSGPIILFYVRVANVTYSVSTSGPAVSQWSHVAVTWDASAQLPLIFIDGVLQPGTAGGSSSTGTSNVMTIGSRTDGQQLFQGQLDEVRIWNTARTACEIRELMHSVPVGNESSLVAYYNFNRGTGGESNAAFTTLPDQAGLYSGTLNNFALNGTTSNWLVSTAPVTATGPQPLYTSTANAVICSGASYAFGTQTLTASGTYDELFASVEGCDSLVTLTLTVDTLQTLLPPVTACSAYTWANTGMEYTASGLYADTLQGISGCDSIVQLDLTIVLPTASTQTATACASYTWPQTGATYSATGLYTDTLMNAAGCDSIVTLDLTILQPTSSTQTAEACDSYTWSQTGETYTASGLYTDTLPNAAGCDSVIVLNLVVYNSFSATEQAVSCGPYTWPVNGQTYAFPGMFDVTLQTVHGCDSVITLSLLVHNALAEVTTNGDGILTATVSETVVAWIDCGTGLAIPGEDDLTFTPVQNGNYAVVGYDGMTGCSDTSACFEVDFVGLEELDAAAMNVWPNPSDDRVTITFSGQEGQLTVYDTQGQLILEQEIASGAELSLEALRPGVYFFGLKTGNGSAVQRVVKR